MFHPSRFTGARTTGHRLYTGLFLETPNSSASFTLHAFSQAGAIRRTGNRQGIANLCPVAAGAWSKPAAAASGPVRGIWQESCVVREAGGLVSRLSAEAHFSLYGQGSLAADEAAFINSCSCDSSNDHAILTSGVLISDPADAIGIPSLVHVQCDI